MKLWLISAAVLTIGVFAGAQSNSKVGSAKHGDARHGGRFIPDPTQRLQPP